MSAKSQAGLTAWELMSILGAHRGDHLAMLYRTFIDDSADERKQIVMVAGALMGTHKQWGAFSREWRRRLSKDRLKYFRSTEYRSLTGEFYRYRDPVRYPKPHGSEAARGLRDDLDLVIKKHDLLGVASVIPLAMFNEVVASEGLTYRFNPDPFSAAMQTVMRECAILARDTLLGDGNNRVAFVCDDGPDAKNQTAAYCDFKNKNTSIQETIGGIVHLDDKKWPPLQAADVVASIAREMATEYIDNQTPVQLKRLQGSFYRMYVWNRETLLQLARAQETL